MQTSRSLGTRAVMALLLMVGFYGFSLAIASGLLWVAYAQFAYLERGNVQLTLFCVVGAGTLLWALVPRVDRFEAPGPRLTPSNAPYLFTIIEEVARATNQPRPEEVYLLPDVNAFVTHRGGMMGVGSKRVMGVGLPLLRGFTPAELRSVIAHEFGHFVSGDVALGPWIYKTRFTIYRALEGVSHSRLLAKLIEWYMRLFLRVTMQVSREQEFVADATAARVAGVAAATSALKRLQVVSPAYGSYVNNEVLPVVRSGFLPPFNDGFERFLADPEMSQALHDFAARSAIGAEAGEFDSHPPLPERVAALEKLRFKVAEHPRDATAVMLKDADRVLRALLEFMWGRDEVAKLEAVSWDEVGEKVWAGQWRATVAEHGAWLGTLTADQIPSDKKWFIAKGYDLAKKHGQQDATADEKIGYAIYVLGCAIGAALMRAGWTAETAPARPLMLRRGDTRFDPRQALRQLADGTLTIDAWKAQCDGLGLTGVPLQQPPASATQARIA